MLEPQNLATLATREAGHRRVIATREFELPINEFAVASSLGPYLEGLRGRSVLLSVMDMAKVAAALIDLDGCARRVVLCPRQWAPALLEYAARDAEADAIVYDSDEAPSPIPLDFAAPCRLPLRPLESARHTNWQTEWVLPTSGTTGPPKFVVHTLRSLTAAIVEETSPSIWATFYDIRRYGGLQIFLRALAGRGSLFLSTEGESLNALLARFGKACVTHISGTPTHWRKVLMSSEARRIDPTYVRLSGEIADDAVLAGLRALYPRARIEHAYASTEAGVVFAVDDGKAGFPASIVGQQGPVQLRIVDNSLRVRSSRCADRLLGADAPLLAKKDSYIDTGDIVEKRGERYYFAGRRSGIINVGGLKVHPEEVEGALNTHPTVHASRVFARKSAITGALVFAEVVLRDGHAPNRDTECDILAACQRRLAPHLVPAGLRFVASLPMTEGGKLARHG